MPQGIIGLITSYAKTPMLSESMGVSLYVQPTLRLIP